MTAESKKNKPRETKPGPINIWMIPCYSKKDRDVGFKLLQDIHAAGIRNYENIKTFVNIINTPYSMTGDKEMDNIYKALNRERFMLLELLGVEPAFCVEKPVDTNILSGCNVGEHDPKR